MKNHLWDRVGGYGSGIEKGCRWVELKVVLTCLQGPGVVFPISEGELACKESKNKDGYHEA